MIQQNEARGREVAGFVVLGSWALDARSRKLRGGKSLTRFTTSQFALGPDADASPLSESSRLKPTAFAAPSDTKAYGTRIIVYQPNETVRLDVRLENETVWLTQEQMSLLFGRDQSVIARHVNNIFNEGELNKNSVYAKNAYTASDGKTYQVAFYNLDVVISVGYRVKSVQGTRFRQWATGVLKEYLIRGYAVNTRLNQLEDKVR